MVRGGVQDCMVVGSPVFVAFLEDRDFWCWRVPLVPRVRRDDVKDFVPALPEDDSELLPGDRGGLPPTPSSTRSGPGNKRVGCVVPGGRLFAVEVAYGDFRPFLHGLRRGRFFPLTGFGRVKGALAAPLLGQFHFPVLLFALFYF